MISFWVSSANHNDYQAERQMHVFCVPSNKYKSISLARSYLLFLSIKCNPWAIKLLPALNSIHTLASHRPQNTCVDKFRIPSHTIQNQRLKARVGQVRLCPHMKPFFRPHTRNTFIHTQHTCGAVCAALSEKQ